jgi:hypothetical protein
VPIRGAKMPRRLRLRSLRGVGALGLLAGAAVLAGASLAAEPPRGCEGADAQLQPAAGAALAVGLGLMCLPAEWRRRSRIAVAIASAALVWLALWIHAFAQPSACAWWQ